jgi:hypothetical protein
VSQRFASLAILASLALAGCATTSGDAVPLARERTVADQVLAFDASREAGGDTSCHSRKIVSTEVTLPFAPGSQGAAGHWTERWTVDRCGRPMPYLVSFVRATDGHLGVGIMRLDGDERATFPGSTIGDRILQRDAFLLIAQKDLSELEGGPCRTRRVTNTELVSPLEGREVEGGRPVAGEWAERWTLDRCGTAIHYIIHFATNRSGTRFFAEREGARPPAAAPSQPPLSAAPIAERHEPAPAPAPAIPAAGAAPAAGATPAPAATQPPKPAADEPADSRDAIDWLLKSHGR